MSNNQPLPSSTTKKVLDSSPEEKKEDNLISISDFGKVSIIVGQILEAEHIEKSEKLLKLKVTVGEENDRQIIAGIAKRYTSEELIGRKALVIANLKPAKLMGNLSEGMILCAKLPDGTLELVSPDPTITNGSKLS